MRYIEVLFIRNETESTEEVFLRRGKRVLRETTEHFNCRMTRPHQSLFECRYVYREDSRLDEYLATLHKIPWDYPCSTEGLAEAFQEMFLVATGFYLPGSLAEFD